MGGGATGGGAMGGLVTGGGATEGGAEGSVGLGVRGLLSCTCTRSPARLLLRGFDGFLPWAQWHRWPLGTDPPLRPLSFRSWEGGGRAERENSSPLNPKWVLLVTSPHPQVWAPPPHPKPPHSRDKRHLCLLSSQGIPGELPVPELLCRSAHVSCHKSQYDDHMATGGMIFGGPLGGIALTGSPGTLQHPLTSAGLQPHVCLLPFRPWPGSGGGL